MNKLCEPPVDLQSACLAAGPGRARHGDWLSEHSWCNNLSVYDCAWSRRSQIYVDVAIRRSVDLQ